MATGSGSGSPVGGGGGAVTGGTEGKTTIVPAELATGPESTATPDTPAAVIARTEK